MKKSCRFPVHIVKSSSPAGLALFAVRIGHFHSDAVAEKFERAKVIKVFRRHNKGYDVAPRPAAEAMITVCIGEHRKRRRLFRMERAKPDKPRSRSFKRYVHGDNLFYSVSEFEIVYEFRRDFQIKLPPFLFYFQTFGTKMRSKVFIAYLSVIPHM